MNGPQSPDSKNLRNFESLPVNNMPKLPSKNQDPGMVKRKPLKVVEEEEEEEEEEEKVYCSSSSDELPSCEEFDHLAFI
jgi:hypothetical protein